MKLQGKWVYDTPRYEKVFDAGRSLQVPGKKQKDAISYKGLDPCMAPIIPSIACWKYSRHGARKRPYNRWPALRDGQELWRGASRQLGIRRRPRTVRRDPGMTVPFRPQKPFCRLPCAPRNSPAERPLASSSLGGPRPSVELSSRELDRMTKLVSRHVGRLSDLPSGKAKQMPEFSGGKAAAKAPLPSISRIPTLPRQGAGLAPGPLRREANPAYDVGRRKSLPVPTAGTDLALPSSPWHLSRKEDIPSSRSISRSISRKLTASVHPAPADPVFGGCKSRRKSQSSSRDERRVHASALELRAWLRGVSCGWWGRPPASCCCCCYYCLCEPFRWLSAVARKMSRRFCE